MRENRQSGSEGGVGESRFRPLSVTANDTKSAALWEWRHRNLPAIATSVWGRVSRAPP
jgi:hypothetical protein